MPKSTRIDIKVGADTGKARSEFDALGKRGKSAFNSVNIAAMAVGHVLGQLATKAIAMVGRGFGKLARSVGEWTDAAATQEAAVHGLNAALASAGQLTPELSQKYQDLASSLQQVTTAGDEELLPLMGQLVNVGGVNEEQMAATTKAALDFAAGMKMDLKSAFQLVAKAAGGNTAALTRYVGTVEQGATKSETLANVVEALNEKFGGQAQAAAETYAGKVKQLGNAWGDMQEQGGSILTQMLKPFVEWAQQATVATTEWIKAHRTELIVKFSNAVLIVVDAVAAVARAGATAVEVYAELRAMFARLLAGALKPVIKAIGWMVDRTIALRKAVGLSTEGLEDFSLTIDDLTAGLEANVKDQERYTETVAEATSKVTAGAAAIREKIAALLEEGKVTEANTLLQQVNADARAAAAAKASEGTQQATLTELEYARAIENTKRITDMAALAAAERLATMTEWAGRFRAELEAIKGATSSVTIGGGVTRDIDKSAPDIAKIIKRIERVATDGFGKFRTAAKSVLQQIQEGDVLGLKEISKYLMQDFRFFRDRVGGAKAAGAAAGLNQLIADLLDRIPGAARGGTLLPMTPTLVGERGAELVMSREYAHVTPNDKVGASLGGGEVVGLLRGILARIDRPVVMGRGAVRMVAEESLRLQGRGALRVGR